MSDLNSNALKWSINVLNHNHLPDESCDSWHSHIIHAYSFDCIYFCRLQAHAICFWRLIRLVRHSLLLSTIITLHCCLHLDPKHVEESTTPCGVVVAVHHVDASRSLNILPRHEGEKRSEKCVSMWEMRDEVTSNLVRDTYSRGKSFTWFSSSH